ncbi:MAG: helix-turn-helix domain-containing protein [Candidatus Bathyarchaeota archaeon]|nr:helix-turn-helix domain-containing protein [Candidatus Bathyarchaeota archaeon]MDH5494412.1 helix-turn-helix domain-containing protein [Candidatus Bathyarchaeota archaeon]
MPNPKLRSIHKAGVRVLKAISAPIRIQILALLLEYGPMSYTEIMNTLKLDATRDAGRFAYHLKSLLKADLIEPDVETKNYRLTDLGRRIIEITDEIDDRTYKRRKMLVRTSHLSIEEFDRNKITQSLITEANVPTDLAQKIAREAEKRLQQFKTKYLTAPLIREIVNTILLEKHYEEYRHKLTRLGLPVHEVTRLIDAPKTNVEAVHKAAGNAVMEEYTLLSILPRSISDAYLSGSLHLNNLGTWTLKPNEITHSLPYFLQFQKPKTLEAALNITTNVTRNTATETTGQQNLDNFNIHLAPYTKDIAPNKIKELLRLFIKNLNQTTPTPTTISLEFSAEKSAAYADETQQLTLFLLETLAEENKIHPLKNPKIIIKTQRVLKTSEAESLLHEVHKLAATSILVYFANLYPDNQINATYTASGLRLADEWQQDWELDTQRTGNLDTATINLPRVSVDAKGDEDKFLELLDDQLNMAKQALAIKYQTIKKRVKQNLLPYLTQKTNGDQYFRLENTTRTIVSMGIKEAVQKLMGKEIAEDIGKAFVITERILKHINAYAKKHAKKPQARLTTAVIPNRTAAKRLAMLDVEKYGWGVVKTKGTRGNPYYSDINTVSPLEKEQFNIEERIHQLTLGGHLALIETEDQQPSVEELLAKTKQLTTSNIGFFAYNLSFTYCHHCKSTSHGTHLKCPNCGSTNILTLKQF